MTKHSKGPWKLDGFYEGDKSSPIYSKSENICEPVCIIPHDDITEDGWNEMEANARLILAAPALLSAAVALRAAQRDYMGDWRDKELAKAVRDAAEKLDVAIKAAGVP